MSEQESYEIPEYEKKLNEIEKLQEEIDNPKPDRLLKDHENLQKELRSLSDKKTMLYAEIKRIIKAEHQLLFIKENKRVCFYTGVNSEVGHPGICYFWEDTLNSTGSITTYSGMGFQELAPKEFMDKLMSGQGFLPNNL
ncbi:hypothetical protein ACFLY5_01010 [Patescibacteria group bacterium]